MKAPGIGVQQKQRAAQLQVAQLLGRVQPMLQAVHLTGPVATAHTIIYAVIEVLHHAQAEVEDVIFPGLRAGRRAQRRTGGTPVTVELDVAVAVNRRKMLARVLVVEGGTQAVVLQNPHG